MPWVMGYVMGHGSWVMGHGSCGMGHGPTEVQRPAFWEQDAPPKAYVLYGFERKVVRLVSICNIMSLCRVWRY